MSDRCIRSQSNYKSVYSGANGPVSPPRELSFCWSSSSTRVERHGGSLEEEADLLDGLAHLAVQGPLAVNSLFIRVAKLGPVIFLVFLNTTRLVN